MTTNRDEDPILVIGYEKYLKCPRCKEVEPYCPEHKTEVEAALSRLNVI
jgi:phage FluMu protein Com